MAYKGTGVRQVNHSEVVGSQQDSTHLLKIRQATLTSDLDSGDKNSKKSPTVETTPKVLRYLLTAPNRFDGLLTTE